MTKQEIMEQLDGLEIDYDPQDLKAKLEKKLNKEIKRLEKIEAENDAVEEPTEPVEPVVPTEEEDVPTGLVEPSEEELEEDEPSEEEDVTYEDLGIFGGYKITSKKEVKVNGVTRTEIVCENNTTYILSDRDIEAQVKYLND